MKVAGCWALALFVAAAAFGQVAIDSNSFGGIRARSIGPAVMSGRIASIDAVPADPESDRRMTIWVGAASGGVWKSVDAGTSFKPVFDDHPQSIGAVRVDPSATDTVWVGTGESWVRNSVSVGRGVYKTTDGGENWELMGLEDSERIGAIRIDPSDGDTVFVCATGHLWDSNEERGVFRTRDGGTTWEKVLYVDADTGCADLDLDPQEPNILYAAMWQYRREPDFFTSGGPGSGLYKSTDGGDTWERLETGLPEGELGRIAVAVAPSRPSRIYAVVEAEKTALYRSDDLGETWTETNHSQNVRMRPFYFAELVVDPVDHRRVYKPGFVLTVSTDGGDSFTSLFSGGFSASIHPDHHALWVDPTNPQTVVLGTDGGVYISRDRAAHWFFVEDLPVSQFYHVAHDSKWPYDVYGGLQDNGTWAGPSRAAGGILNGHWRNVGFGDGFWAFPDPTTPGHVFVEYQGGQLMRVAEATSEVKSIHPYAGDGEEELRFNWNTPIHMSPNDPAVLYYGSQYLHRSDDRGESWRTISPDLTTDNPEKQRQAQSGGLTTDNTTAENYCTIYTISESPLDAQVIWAGTDDGHLQITRDGGETWTEVSDHAEGVPDGTWVSRVEASSHDAATAFVTFDGHRTGDMATYVYKTTDYGATFTSLGTDDLDGFAWVVKQDPVHPDLLYLGTEHGLFLSVDGGGRWARFKENLPPVAVHDLVIHPTEHDLVIGTHGRGIYILDDLTPLRNLTQEVLDSDVALLPSRPAAMIIPNQLQWFPADHEFVGENPPEAAWITYYLKKRHLFGDLKIEVYADDGELITTIPGAKRRGLNRVVWPMRLKPPKFPAATSLVPGFLGPRVKEGKYKIRLIKGKETLEGEVELVADPRSPHSAEDRALQQEKALELYHLLGELTYLAESLEALRDGAEERAGSDELRPADAAKLTGLSEAAEELRATLVSTHPAGMLSGEERLRETLGNLYGKISSFEGRPTDSQLAQLGKLVADLDAAEQGIEDFFATELPAANRILERRGLEPLSRLSREDWEAKEVGGGTGPALPRQEMTQRLTLAQSAF